MSGGIESTLAAFVIMVLLGNPAIAQRDAFAPPAASEQLPIQIPSERLIGRQVRNARDETIGVIKFVVLGNDGRVRAVVVDAGRSLGLGEREVAIPWSTLRVRNNGEVIATSLTDDQLRALPPYRADGRPAREVIAAVASPKLAQADVPQATMTPGAWNMRASELLGMDVRNAQNESIGQIKELVIGLRGDVQAVVVSVGGFLGLGDRNVAVGWKEFQFNREKGGLTAALAVSREQLKSLPEYKLPKR